MCKGPEAGGSLAHSGDERGSVRLLQSEMREGVTLREGHVITGPVGLGDELGFEPIYIYIFCLSRCSYQISSGLEWKKGVTSALCAVCFQ